MKTSTISQWRLTPRERFLALLFGKVRIQVSGVTQPPVNQPPRRAKYIPSEPQLSEEEVRDELRRAFLDLFMDIGEGEQLPVYDLDLWAMLQGEGKWADSYRPADWPWEKSLDRLGRISDHLGQWYSWDNGGSAKGWVTLDEWGEIYKRAKLARTA